MSSSAAENNAAAAETEGTTEAVDAAAKAANKRYGGLVMVRNKAIKGKGAWYWSHLEPLLVHDNETGLPKAVKLKCSLCDSLFSASNPSRTASEHLKRGTCPNFAATPTPISSVSPNATTPMTQHQHQQQLLLDSTSFSSQQQQQTTTYQNHRKRSSSSAKGNGGAPSAAPSPSSSSYQVSPLAIVDPSSRYCPEASVYASGTTPQGGGGASQQRQVLDQYHHHHQYHHHQQQQQQQHGSSSSQHMHQQQQQQQQQHLVLSGGKEDLGALAMLEDSVKRLKSPKTSPGPALSKTQVDCAIDYLSDWVYESCGSVSFSALEHPKFKLFLTQVGLPGVSRREICGSRLDSKYEEAKSEAEAKIRDAMFFQIASDGWASKGASAHGVVNLSVNLPNGTSVYRRAVFVGGGQVPAKYAEEVLWETITDTCGNGVQQCVGIVADRFKNKALRDLETQNQWMVNFCCQCQGFSSLIKDLYRELPLFKNVAENCIKVGSFVNNKSQIRSSFCKYQLREDGYAGLLRVPQEVSCSEPVYVLIEDILSSARALQSVLLEESYKMVLMEDQAAREFGEMIRDVGFWNGLEAVHSLVKLVKEMVHEMESERPLVGQCLPLWDELRSKVRDWCAKFHISEGPVEKVIEKRFRKNYHPAWAAAYILDPLYLIRDTSGKYLPPFKYLTHQQEKDVDKLITRLVSREEAHIALMELMKWRTEGLDPVYAQAVQLKQRDPLTGKMRIANPQSSRLVWETYLSEFKSLGKVAVRLIFLHATCRSFKSNWSSLRWIQTLAHSRSGMERAQKLIFIAAQSKLERRDFSNDEDKDAELLALPNGEDDVLNEVFVDPSSM